MRWFLTRVIPALLGTVLVAFAVWVLLVQTGVLPRPEQVVPRPGGGVEVYRPETPVPTPVPTKTPEPTKAPEVTKVPKTVVSACRHIEWLQNAISDTKGTSELIAVADRDFVKSEGGEWSEPGYTVQSGNVFWTDLGEGYEPPAYVKRIRTQGNWGVYATTQDYTIPSPNGGGRHVRICEGVDDIKVSVAPPGKVALTPSTAKPTCIATAEISAITSASDPVASFNTYYEKVGYQFGKSVAVGEKVSTGLFLGTFPNDKIPEGIKDLAKGYIWKVSQEVTSPNGGRWMRSCK